MTTDQFRILLFDDEQIAHDRLDEELDAAGWNDSVFVELAYSPEQCRRLAEKQYFHLFLIDIFDGSGPGGIEVIRAITSGRPEASIVIVTAWRRQSADNVVDLFGSGAHIVGFGSKHAGEAPWYASFIVEPYRNWLDRRVVCEGLDGENGVVAALLDKRERINSELARTSVALYSLAADPVFVREEVVELVSRVFGVSALKNRDEPVVRLKVLRKGFSSSVVVEAIPIIPVEGLSDPVLGNRCVLKFGPAPAVVSETLRYDKVVRFGIALENRVELLGHASGKSLGVVCYSFAGSRVETDLVSFDEMLGMEGRNWRPILMEMFAPETSAWYSVRQSTKSLQSFFLREYDADLEVCIDNLTSWLLYLRDEIPTLNLRDYDKAADDHRDGWKLRIGMNVLSVPARNFLFVNAVSKPTRGCLVHGDLHAGNVLVDASSVTPSFRIIDYGNAGLGPRFIDFAAMQASARLQSLKVYEGQAFVEATVGEMIGECLPLERSLLQQKGGFDSGWAHVSSVVAGLAFANFGDADMKDLAWTELCFALALFRFEDFSSWGRFRMLVWISALVEFLQAGTGT